MIQKRKILIISLFLLLIILVLALLPQKASALTLAEQLAQHDFLKQAWKYVLGILNAIVVLGLIVVALANILRLNIETYHIKRMLPSIILGVILANFSYLISRLFVDFAQVIADFFLFGQPYPLLTFAPGRPIEETGGYLILSIFGLETLISGGAGTGTVAGLWILVSMGLSAGPISLAVIAILAIIFLVVVGPPVILMLVLGILLAVRIYLIWFLTIVSPLAFFSLVFTPLNKIWQTWWSWFVKWVFLAPIAFFFIKLATIVARAQWPVGTGGGFAKWFFGIVLFCLAIYIPLLVGGKIVSGWANLWKGLAGGGFKGLKYAGVAAGAGMMRWGEARNKKLKGDYGKTLMGLGNTLQRASHYEGMKRELQNIPGGYAVALGLEAREAEWEKQISHGAIAGFLGGKEIINKQRSAASEKYYNIKTTEGLQNALNAQGVDFNDLVLPQDKLEEKYKGRAQSEAVGARWAMGRILAESPGGDILKGYADAYWNQYSQEVTLPIEEGAPKGMAEAKDRYDAAYQRVQQTYGTVIGHTGGGLSYANIREQFSKLQGLQGDEKTNYARGIARHYGANTGEILAVKSAEDLSRMQSERVLKIRKRAPDFAAQAERVVPYITTIKEIIKVEPAAVDQVAAAVKRLGDAGGSGATGPVINESVEVLRKIGLKVKTEIDVLRENPGKLFNELKILNNLGKVIRQNPTATNETIQQQVRIKLAEDYQAASTIPAAPTTPTPPVPGSTTPGTPTEGTATAEKPAPPPKPAPPEGGGAAGGGDGTTPTPKTPAAPKSTPPAAGVEVTPQRIAELDETIKEARTRGDSDRVKTFTELRNELQQKGKRG